MHLITGGAGFIGSNIAGALAARGDRVVIADFFGRGDKWKNIAKHNIYDFINPTELDSWLASHAGSISNVIHMGGVSATTESDCDLIIRSNFRLSTSLWKWCALHDVPLIYASSAAVYGDGGRGYSDDCAPKLLASLRPLNPYGWSKLAFDRRAMASIVTGETSPPKWAGLRFFNVYGPNEYHKASMRSVIAANFESVVSGGSIRLFKSYAPDYPDGGQMRDFIWIADCVDIVLWMLDNPSPSGIYNVGSGKARTWKDLGSALSQACGMPERIEFIDMPQELQARYQYFTEANIEKLRRAGYLRPMTVLEDGISTYVRDYLSQVDPHA